MSLHAMSLHTVATRCLVFLAIALSCGTVGSSGTGTVTADLEESLDMPWRQAGLTERRAAAHLLDRFTFGPRPGEVDLVVTTGLERWFLQQLLGEVDEDPWLERFLRGRPTLDLETMELVEQYPPRGFLIAMAAEQGVIDLSADDRDESDGEDGGDRARQQALEEFAREQGFKPQKEALADLHIQKLARARYSERQLHEVLTEFWFNHFNVSLTDTQARLYLWPYERDAIRPHVVGSFRDILGATARHPAMLLYLDNAHSVAGDDVVTTLDVRLGNAIGRGRRTGPGRGDRRSQASRIEQRRRQRVKQRDATNRRRPTGLNENYARELMELHTLGVDGGYSQDDVVEVARAFTGWSVVSPRGLPERLEQADPRRRRRAGFVIEDGFLFRADTHDAEAKTVLGQELPPGRGVEDGEDVLDLLAAHPSAARHLSTKLAVRFVSDQPPEPLVDRLTATYLDTGGDLRSMMVTLVESPEFWSVEAIGQKIKSPFELTMSALRALDARPRDPRALVDWIRRMGQPLYAYQAPTGYPDRAEAWVNTGSLLQRMNFGLQLATGRIPGIQLDLDRRSFGLSAEASAEEQLRHWLAILMPERDPEPTVRRLLPAVNDPELAEKIAGAAPEGADDETSSRRPTGMPMDDWDVSMALGTKRNSREALRSYWRVYPDDSFAAQVVGVILGSPEFQRR